LLVHTCFGEVHGCICLSSHSKAEEEKYFFFLRETEEEKILHPVKFP